MKTELTKFLLSFALLAYFVAPSAAQNAPEGEKKIVIIKKRIDADGSEVTETIVKKGKSAENFDADAFLEENEGQQISIKIEEGNRRSSRHSNQNWEEWGERMGERAERWAEKFAERAEEWGEKFENRGMNNFCHSGRGYLGVDEDEEERENGAQPGVFVDVHRGSAAETAGLRSNDLILKLDDTAINTWSDLSKFMANTKADQVVQVTFSRNGGAPQILPVTLAKNTCWNTQTRRKKGFLGVTDYSDDDKILGVKVNIVKNSAAETAGLKNGDEILMLNDVKIYDDEDITDFMRHTDEGQKIDIRYRRAGQEATAQATLTSQKSNDYHYNYNFNNNFNNGVATQNREKEACLGVYTHRSGNGDEQGAQVDNFTTESAARDAAMQTGDVVLAINGNRVKDSDELWEEIAAHKVGDQVSVQFLRNGQKQTIQATLKACKDRSNMVSVFQSNSNDCGENDPFLGVTVEAEVRMQGRTLKNDASEPGILLGEIIGGTAAELAGLQRGDIIFTIDGEKTDAYKDLSRIITSKKVGDKIKIEYERNGNRQTTEATLQSCKSGNQNVRQFQTWNWNQDDDNRLRQQKVITIRKGEGDAAAPAPNPFPVPDRNLKLNSFRAFPNPTQGQITVEFRGEAVPTIVTLFDASGRQLFREELNAFSGQYSQQFDLSAYSKGVVVVQIVQNDKVFSEQVIVN